MDSLRTIDSRHSVILLLPGLSAAFDTFEHSILLSRLSTCFGIRGTVLAWFRSYLTSRQQYVCAEGCMFSLHSLDWDVPRGSVLGPLLYLVYISLICKIIRRHHLARSFTSPSRRNRGMIFTWLRSCVRDIDTWMLYNGLKTMLHEAIFLATCNGTMTNKKPCKLQRGCYTQATCLATLRKVEGCSTFLATELQFQNGVLDVNFFLQLATQRELFLATCNAT